MDNTFYSAFSISPVPQPTTDTPTPELFRGIYGMPSFLTVPTADLERSSQFWTDGLGFFDFFTAPDQFVHLRRWAFQDVLLVPGETASGPSTSTMSFACVESQLQEIIEACENLVPGCTTGPEIKPWNSIQVDVLTPEKVHVTMTAARPFDPDSAAAEALKEVGIQRSE